MTVDREGLVRFLNARDCDCHYEVDPDDPKNITMTETCIEHMNQILDMMRDTYLYGEAR